MNKREIAEEMLNLLRNGRPDAIAMICEVTIMCRNRVVENRKRGVLSSSLYTTKDADNIMVGGELADEILPVLKKEDLLGVEALLKTYVT